MKIALFIIIAFLVSEQTFAKQGIGINTTNPQGSLHVAGDLSFVSKETEVVTLVGVANTGQLKEFPLGSEFEFVDGTLVITPVLDENILLVGDVDQSPDAGTTSVYHNYDIGIGASNVENTIIRLTGESSGYSISGFTGGYDGRVIYVYNAQSHNVTFLNQDNGSVFENQLFLNSGTSGINGEGVAEFIYDGDSQKWILINIRT